MNVEYKFSDKYHHGEDFYLWVNSHWIENNPIPDNYQRWGAFNELDLDIKNKIKMILEDPKNKNLNILYTQGLDLEKRKKNMEELKEYLKPIQNARSIEELMNVVIDYKISYGIKSPVNFVVSSDYDKSDFNILHLYAGGLGLPDRDYYFTDSHKKEREGYKIFLENYGKLFNLDITGIYDLEEKLAEKSYTSVQKRKPEIQNNPKSLNEIIMDYPNFTFVKYFFEKIGKEPQKINMNNPTFFKLVNDLLSESLQVWKNYFCYKFVMSVISYLSEEAEILQFNFYSKVLSGTKEMHPIWKRSLVTTQNQFGFLIGKVFVEKYFSSYAKSKALEMVEYIKKYLRERIIQLDWMSNNTKLKALDKLDAMIIKIGYPDKWREYKADINESYSYLKNNLNCNIDDNTYEYNKLYKDVDKNEWYMFPQEVNAYYNPFNNEIVFPAGILQKPFFSDQYDIALNFGGIGSVIGHEITHGFDDQGCKFDAKGNLKNWWEKSDYDNYKLKTELIKEQFNKYQINGINVNGELTLGENIADLGGVHISLQSMKKYLEDHPEEDVVFNNLTPYQRFFINYAVIWRSNTRDEEIKNRLTTDPHSPPPLRVNGILKNIDEFYNSFTINKEQKLYLDYGNRLRIW